MIESPNDCFSREVTGKMIELQNDYLLRDLLAGKMNNEADCADYCC
jgi:hypothetical protein